MKHLSIPRNWKIGCGALLLALLIITPTIANCKRVSEVQAAIATLSAGLNAGETPIDGYLVKATAGGVMLFDRASGEEITALPITLSSLPASDRAALERGVALFSVREVISLLQDCRD